MCPMIPPTYQGLPEEKKKLFKRVDPVIWYYQLEVKLDMPGMMATDIKWRVPFVVGAWPIKLLQEMYPDMYAKTFEAIESAGIANEGEESRYDEETNLRRLIQALVRFHSYSVECPELWFLRGESVKVVIVDKAAVGG